MPKEQAKPADMLDRVRSAQHAIVSHLVEWERSLVTLYVRYSQLFPEEKDFWASLAREEDLHSRAAAGLHELIEQGHVLNNIGEFSAQRIEEELHEIREAIGHAEAGTVTLQDAVATAMSVEASFIDTEFYQTVTCDCPTFKKVASILIGQTEVHVRRIEERFAEYFLASRA